MGRGGGGGFPPILVFQSHALAVPQRVIIDVRADPGLGFLPRGEPRPFFFFTCRILVRELYKDGVVLLGAVVGISVLGVAGWPRGIILVFCRDGIRRSHRLSLVIWFLFGLPGLGSVIGAGSGSLFLYSSGGAYGGGLVDSSRCLRNRFVGESSFY